MERRWRFVYDEKRAGQWAWQVHDNMRVKIASLRAFATLDGCIDHARASGFSFAQSYDIVFPREPGKTSEAGG
jgi:hypothetical protein